MDAGTIEKKIKELSAKEIILLMLEGLENPVTKINMDTYGDINKGICYGCAATNALLILIGWDAEELLKNARNYANRPENSAGQGFFIPSMLGDSGFLQTFESAINNLRIGDVNGYNTLARLMEFAVISEVEGLDLPYIGSDNYQDPETLNPYRELAEAQQ